jgi:hypothetical protein
MAEMNERDRKLAQWLGEAHAKEAELEADLTAHIALTEKQSYKKRLRKHLTETKDHKRRVASDRGRRGGGQGRRRGQGSGWHGAGADYSAARDARAKCPGGAARGARRDRHLHAHRDAGHRGRRPRDGAAGQVDPP